MPFHDDGITYKKKFASAVLPHRFPARYCWDSSGKPAANQRDLTGTSAGNERETLSLLGQKFVISISCSNLKNLHQILSGKGKSKQSIFCCSLFSIRWSMGSQRDITGKLAGRQREFSGKIAGTLRDKCGERAGLIAAITILFEEIQGVACF
jgi:hypothetical protein